MDESREQDEGPAVRVIASSPAPEEGSLVDHSTCHALTPTLSRVERGPEGGAEILLR
jgi:hypothetical protein